MECKYQYFINFISTNICSYLSHKSKICLFLTQDASIILMKYRAGATITNGAGETPLHIAARCIILLFILAYLTIPLTTS